MKGDITIRPDPARDARLEKIAARYGTTINQVIGMAAEAISHAPPSHLYHCLAAIQDRIEELRSRSKQKPGNTGKHRETPLSTGSDANRHCAL